MKARFEATLNALERRNRQRRLMPARGLDFTSNDYLGLSVSPILERAAMDALDRNVPLGSGGSRLLRGNHAEHEALETEAARYFHSEAALYLGSGFQANQAIFSSLPAAGDLILYDELIHASTHEGMRLGRAETLVFPHNDVNRAEETLRSWRASGGTGHVWIAIESLYSMEGDLAPLKDLDALAMSTGAVLVIDEAHATGVFGAQGCGLAHGLGAETLTLHTCGKALGVSGGLVCGSRVLIETLINRARPFVFATAPSPMTAALVRASLRALEERPGLQAAAQSRIDHAQGEARRCCGLAGLESQIIPVIVGDDNRTMSWAGELQRLGFDARGIRPPTVPRGTSRLRISITAHVSHPEITALFEAISKLLEEGK
ncbi:8-amino-7-oxononanoate synthase [uncultured Roseibium sp.]|uniref:8-amino-7-oxononanoate synthase n=1 Tax=uncultured Roseibium sp. TaxID=1936171 RepID=UPI00262254C4|nr:8-amino-7-oxononanoate synthase [uncultured Roseibium sp.]